MNLRSIVFYINQINRSFFLHQIIFCKFLLHYQIFQIFKFFSNFTSSVVMTSTAVREDAFIRDELRSRDRFRKNSVVVIINFDFILFISSSSSVNSKTIRRARVDFARRKNDSNCLRCAKNANVCWRRNDVACNYCAKQKNKCVIVNDSISVRFRWLILLKSQDNFVESRINWLTFDVEFVSRCCRRKSLIEKRFDSSLLWTCESVLCRTFDSTSVTSSWLIRFWISYEIFRIRFELALIFFCVEEASLTIRRLIEMLSRTMISFFFRRMIMMKMKILTFRSVSDATMIRWMCDWVV